ncbi:Protein CBG05533 [Caenorhabditis briggsae]|uniref:Protein CBG05533 n=1 Tax=Caenorhabditis briggsae TaxID=6238 RepID=A8X037_CAEBR|nr:Protein CBG05533 [Caenorhabditis briggsae]CAP25997.1 Protein CBG05533 [Caenorhabditis briggsae]
MFKYLLVVILLIALIELATADFSCYFSDSICKSITCRNCKVATCITGDCVCTLCDL